MAQSKFLTTDEACIIVETPAAEETTARVELTLCGTRHHATIIEEHDTHVVVHLDGTEENLPLPRPVFEQARKGDTTELGDKETLRELAGYYGTPRLLELLSEVLYGEAARLTRENADPDWIRQYELDAQKVWRLSDDMKAR